MLRYIIRRLLIAIPILLISSIMVFTVINLTTDPVAGLRTNPRITQEDQARYRHTLGLDKSPVQRYLVWLGNFVKGNWGESLFTQRAVSGDIKSAFGNSLQLGLT